MRKKIFVLVISLCCLHPHAKATLPDVLSKSILEPATDYVHDLDHLAKMSGGTGDYFRLKKAEQYLKSGQTKAALKLVSQVKEPLFDFWKQVVRSELYWSEQKPREILATLKRLPTSPEYRISFNEGLYESLFKRALIVRYLARTALNNNPESDAAKLLAYFPGDAEIETLLKNQQHLNVSLSKELKLARLHQLHDRFQFNKIKDLISVSDIQHAKASSFQKCQGYFELGNAVKFTRGYQAKAKQAFEEVLKNNCGNDFEPRALYWLGSIRGDSTMTDTRELYLKKLYSRFPNHRLGDDALYKLYFLAVETNNAGLQKSYYQKLMSLPRGDMKSILAFNLAFPEYKKGQYKKAASILKDAIHSEPTADETYPRVLYWYARSLEKTGDKKQNGFAKATYQKLANEFPFSFYAILAARRLGTTVRVSSVPQLATNTPSDLPESFALVESFLSKDLHEAARVSLDLILHNNRNLESSHKEFITQKLMESHNYRKALDLAAEHFDSGFYGPITGANDPMFAALFPWAFKEKTKIGYEQSGLPKGAIEGIMREESLFQTRARSSVGAQGLMQLMPATARMVKDRHLSGLNISADIQDPRSNILLGSTYLKNMKSYFHDQLPLAIMAYNAGPGNVNKWIKRFGNKELDEFIEEIPFEETKGYVKRVMRSMQVYGSLYKERYFKDPNYFSFKIEAK